jgi:cytochrome c biogenesis protein CcmG/thiol:disulfide interchange protein DsbE
MSPLRRRLLFGVPLALVSAGGAAMYTLLERMRTDQYDPHAFPSPLLGKPVPAFSLPGAGGLPGFASTDLAAPPRPVLVNWFSSWCAVCPQEAPQLSALARQGVPVWGIDYEDTPAALAQFLSTNGTPYARIGDDKSGLTAINWGVYGVPETFMIDKTGIVRWHFAGALTDDLVTEQLQPLLERYA